MQSANHLNSIQTNANTHSYNMHTHTRNTDYTDAKPELGANSLLLPNPTDEPKPELFTESGKYFLWG